MSCPSIIALTETWLSNVLGSSEISISGYQCFRRDRNRHGGGLALYVHDDVSVSNFYCHPDIELLSADIHLRHYRSQLILYYRPPALADELHSLAGFLQSIPPQCLRSSILLGDFNVNLLTQSPLSLELQSIASEMSFTQVVKEPTRFANNSSSLIDHVYLTNPELLLSCFTTSPLHFSDHNCLNISLKVYSHPVAFKRRDVWRYKHGDFEKANDLLSCFPDVDFSNASSLWSHWKVFFLSTMRQCIPSKNVFIRSAPRWLTSDIKRLIKRKSRLFRRAKRSNSIQAWEKFKSTRNKLVSAVRSAKGAYFRKLVIDFNSPQDFWSHYHSLKLTTSRIPIVLYNGHMSALSTTAKSNLLNSFFCSWFSQKQEFTPNLHLSSDMPKLDSISCSAEDIYHLLTTMKIKTACGADGMSSTMLRNTASSISPFLCKLFNNSLSTGLVPSDWKVSNIVPIPKGMLLNVVTIAQFHSYHSCLRF